MIRNKCIIEDCNRLGRNKGHYKGNIHYGKYCDYYHKLKYNINNMLLNKQSINNSTCSLCGWNKGPCDRHRLVPELGYTLENVIILCPNCHRLVTLGLVTLEYICNE